MQKLTKTQEAILSELSEPPKKPEPYDTLRTDGHYSMSEIDRMSEDFILANLEAIKKSLSNPRKD